MTDINFNCPSCGQKIAAPSELAGAKVPCPSCQCDLQIPVQADPPPAVAMPVPLPTALPPPPAPQPSHIPHFVAAKCPSCGGDLQVPDDRDHVKCMYCGGAVIIRQAIQLASGVNVPNLMALAGAAAAAQNPKEAYDYYTKVLEYDPRNSEAWFGKGESAGWMSTVAQLRTPEMIAALTNALKYAPDSDKPALRLRCGDAITTVSAACYSISKKHLDQFCEVDRIWPAHLRNCDALLDALDSGLAFHPANRTALELLIRICSELIRCRDPVGAWLGLRCLTDESAANLSARIDEAEAQFSLIDPSYVKPNRKVPWYRKEL
jgi:tetratricopeptide (TPR) repeat protein